MILCNYQETISPQLDNHKLHTVFEHLNADKIDFHRATGDSYCAAKIYVSCKQMYDADNAVKKAQELEKEDKIDEAIVLYNKAIPDCLSPLPYERLAILYRKRKDYQKEIMIIEQALAALSAKPNKEYHINKINKFTERLEKTKALQEVAASKK